MMPFLVPRSTPSAQLPAQPNVPEPADHHSATHAGGVPVWGHLQPPTENGGDLDAETEVHQSKCLLVDPDSARHMPGTCAYSLQHLGGHSWEHCEPVLTERRRAEIDAQETGALPVRTPGVVLGETA